MKAQTVKKGGRPEVNEAERHDQELKFRVNKAQKQALDEEFRGYSRGRKVTYAEFLRGKLLAKQVQIVPVSELSDSLELLDELGLCRRELTGVVTNYNQTTKRINAIDHLGKLFNEVQQQKVILEEIRELVAKIDVLIDEKAKWLSASKPGRK